MSYRIEYRYSAYRLDPADTGLAEPRYVVAILGGDNNCYEGSGRNARRSRSWSVCMLGTAEQVLRQAVYYAGACAGGSLQPDNRHCTPEAYIRRIRRLIQGSLFETRGQWSPEVSVSPDHPLVEEIRALGIEPREEPYYGGRRAVAHFGRERLADFFRLVDDHLHPRRMSAWSFATVHGLSEY